MISAVSEAIVPKICVVVRKAYGAGLYAMSGPGFAPDVTLALPQAMIAVMGPEAAVNAVFYNKIQEKPEAERQAYVQQLRDEYRHDVDIYKLASELIVDEIVAGRRAARRAGEALRRLLRAAAAARAAQAGRAARLRPCRRLPRDRRLQARQPGQGGGPPTPLLVTLGAWGSSPLSPCSAPRCPRRPPPTAASTARATWPSARRSSGARASPGWWCPPTPSRWTATAPSTA